MVNNSVTLGKKRSALPTPNRRTNSPPLSQAELAKAKTRHVWLLCSFILFFLAPVSLSTGYLYWYAKDQYASSVGFVVRSEEVSSPRDILGGITSLSGSNSSDTDILYEFIQSQQLVRIVDEELGLREIFGKFYEQDPVFGFDPEGSIEDLTTYWARMVKVYYDSGTGLIELRVTAFDAQDAFNVATAIFNNSSSMINELSAIAQEDATGYAQADLNQAVETLKNARQSILEYRARTQIVDPEADLQGQMGILNNLQQQYAEALIDLDLLRETTSGNSDPRVVQAMHRINVIEARIADERAKFGTQTDTTGQDYVEIIGEFERLNVDLEFAQQTYLSALANLNSSRADAQRQSRYLAPYLAPSVAERAKYPERATLVLLVFFFTFMGWMIMSLVYYSIRDRN